jgi:hypothetical protein
VDVEVDEVSALGHGLILEARARRCRVIDAVTYSTWLT